MTTKQCFLAFCFLFNFLLPITFAFAQSPAAMTEASSAVKTTLLYDRTALQPPPNAETPAGRIGVRFQIAPGWHIYWRNTGQAGLPTRIDWELPEDWKASQLRWPTPYKIVEQGGIITYGYTNEVLLFADLFPPLVIPDVKQRAKIGANVSWLACKNVCIPGQSSLEIILPFSTSEALATSKEYSLFEEVASRSPQTLQNDSQSSKFEGPWKAFRLETLSSQIMASPGQAITDFLRLRHVPIKDVQRISQQIQVFPYASGDFEIGETKIVAVSQVGSQNLSPSASSHETTDTMGDKPADIFSDFLITIPILISSEAAMGSHIIQGSIAFAPELFGPAQRLNKTGLTLEWSLPIVVVPPQSNLVPKDKSILHPEIEALLKNDSNFHILTDRVVGGKEQPSPGEQVSPTAARGTNSGKGFAFALLSAFLGGIILNLMPCVLPIIAIKVLGIVKQTQQSPKRRFTYTLSFMFGILSSFLFLALLVISFRSVGHQLGWGFQLQSPSFVFLLALTIFVLSLSLFDVFTVSLPFLQKANVLGSRISAPFFKHFFEGILTTLLSTPCTAPILYSALAFAFSAPPIFTIAIFLAVGFGLSFPYLLLASNTKLLNLLPRPGNWMIAFRQLMGFFLLATVVWLLFILQHQTEDGASWALGVLLVAYFCFWLKRTLSKEKDPGAKKIFVSGVIGVFFLLVLFSAWSKITGDEASGETQTSELIQWQPYSPKLIEVLKAKGTPIFIDFTADWCVTCKVNEFLVVETAKVAQAIRDYGITAVKGDWTKGDETITKALNSFGAQGVPLYVVIPKGGREPLVLSSILTSGALLDAFRNAAAGERK